MILHNIIIPFIIGMLATAIILAVFIRWIEKP